MVDWIAIVVAIVPDLLTRIYRREHARQTKCIDSAFWQGHRLVFNIDHELLNAISYLNRYAVSIW